MTYAKNRVTDQEVQEYRQSQSTNIERHKKRRKTAPRYRHKKICRECPNLNMSSKTQKSVGGGQWWAVPTRYNVRWRFPCYPKMSSVDMAGRLVVWKYPGCWTTNLVKIKLHYVTDPDERKKMGKISHSFKFKLGRVRLQEIKQMFISTWIITHSGAYGCTIRGFNIRSYPILQIK